MDVSVEDWYAFAVCYGAYCTSRVATDAWDRGLEDSGVVWEFTVEFVNDKLGTFEESLCSRVVAQAFPEGVDLFNVGPGQILDCRKCLHPAIIVWDDGVYACLLEHNLGYPYL